MTCPAFIKDDEVAEDDNSDARVSGRPNNHSFMFENAEQWTDAPLDLSALPEFKQCQATTWLCEI